MLRFDAITVGQLRAVLADLDPNDLVYTTSNALANDRGIQMEYLRAVDSGIGEIELAFGQTEHDRFVFIDDTVTEMALQEAVAEMNANGELAPVTELRPGTWHPSHGGNTAGPRH